MGLKYEKEEKEVLEKALETAINELNRLWLIEPSKEICVNVYLPGVNKIDKDYKDRCQLIIDETGIYLKHKRCRYHLAKRKNFEEAIDIFNSIGEEDIIFLNEFEKIRDKVASIVEQNLKVKTGNLEKAKSLINKYSQPTIVEIDLPTTINQQTIEVVEENGQTIGTLNFGNMALRIISDANIEFVSKDNNKTVKRK